MFAVLLLCYAISGMAETGHASWYGAECAGLPMANGKPFDPKKLTAASWAYPLGTRVKVTSGDRSVVVTITDRGPNKRLVKQGRVIDLSRSAFLALGDLRAGLIPVTVTPISKK